MGCVTGLGWNWARREILPMFVSLLLLFVQGSVHLQNLRVRRYLGTYLNPVGTTYLVRSILPSGPPRTDQNKVPTNLT